jgi:hypothetical protein
VTDEENPKAIPAPKRCGFFQPGHDVHHIPALRAGNEKAPDRRPARLVDVGADGVVTLDVDGEQLRFWNHDPARILAAATRAPGPLELDRRWRFLRIPSGPDSTSLFSLAHPDDHQECPDAPPTGDPARLAMEAGGFLIAGRDLKRSRPPR